MPGGYDSWEDLQEAQTAAAIARRHAGHDGQDLVEVTVRVVAATAKAVLLRQADVEEVAREDWFPRRALVAAELHRDAVLSLRVRRWALVQRQWIRP